MPPAIIMPPAMCIKHHALSIAATVSVLLVVTATMSGTASSASPFASSASSAFGWKYNAPLDEANWWSIGFPQCNAAVYPHQSPVDISVVSTGTVPLETFSLHGLPGKEAPASLKAIMVPDALNILRADLWPGELVVDILRNGEPASNATKYVLHHLSVNTPSEHTLNGTKADAELSYVFFPYTASATRSSYRRGGVKLVALCNVRDDAHLPAARLDDMLEAFEASKSYGTTSLRLYLPSFGAVGVYNGSMTYPPCTQELTTLVTLQPLPMRATTHQSLVGVQPRSAGTRTVQSLQGRTIRLAQVTVASVFTTPPTLGEIRQRPQAYIISSSAIDVTTDAYGYGALCCGLLCGLLAVCVGVQLYERHNFVSATRDIWANTVTRQTAFGAANKGDDAATDERTSSAASTQSDDDDTDDSGG